MGAHSALVRLLMRSVASTNVMTTNTTVLAINAAETLLGWIERRKSGRSASPDADYARARRELAALIPLGLGCLGGTAFGAIAYVMVGLPCVIVAILAVGVLAVWYQGRR